MLFHGLNENENLILHENENMAYFTLDIILFVLMRSLHYCDSKAQISGIIYHSGESSFFVYELPLSSLAYSRSLSTFHTELYGS